MDSKRTASVTFKKCSMCNHVWSDREAFLSDPELVLVGYQVNFKELEAGLLLFQHDVGGCRTTVALKTEQFRDLYAGPVYTERKTDSEECPSYCLYEEELGTCLAACECAFVREVLQIVKEWPKRA